MAWDKPNEVFEKPNWLGKTPKFINENDLIKFKIENGYKTTISKEEIIEIDQAKEIYDKWTKADTDSPLVNAAINQLVKTGYMLGRMRMITVSYLTQDNGLWWKYAEKFFANNLIDYDKN